MNEHSQGKGGLEATLPGNAGRVAQEQPSLWRAYQTLGEAAGQAGPLNERERRIVHLAFALGADSQGATHSHTRRALTDGFTAAELDHVAFLAIATLGWPHAIRGLGWIRDISGGAANEER